MNHRVLILGFVLMLAATGLVTAAADDEIFVLSDPKGDDHGDGNLVYPLNGILKEGDLDIVAFRATRRKNATVFEIEFDKRIRKPERGAIDDLGTDLTSVARHGFYTFNIDVYIDTDRRPDSGLRRTLPGRKAVLDIDHAWEHAVVLTPRPGVARKILRSLVVRKYEERLDDPRTRHLSEAQKLARQQARLAMQQHVFFSDKIRVSGRNVTFEVPDDFFGEPASPDWSYLVFVTGSDLVTSLDLGASVGLSEATQPNLMVLPISPDVWRNRFGGGRRNEPLQPPIVDVIVPPDKQQEWLLGDFDSQADLPVSLPGVVPSGKQQAMVGAAPLATATVSGTAAAGAAAAGVADVPQWQNGRLHGQVFYEVFVRSFADSDGDGIGDLAGLTARLDYLNDGDPETDTDLGVDGLWLMPIFASPSYHGYNCTDYYRINPDYGTEAEFDTLITHAHARGIQIVLDLMLNHTSDQHPWFEESAYSPDSPLRDWYVWRTDDPGWTQPWGGDYRTWHQRDGHYYYGLFWGGMPDLNFRNRDVLVEAEKIVAFWLARGIDGFRFDAARHLVADGPGQQQNDTPETHAAWRRLAASVRRQAPAAMMLGEIWSDTPTIATYYGATDTVAGGDEFPMTFNFPLGGAIIAAVRDGDRAPVDSVLTAMQRLYPAGALDGTFLTNHDMIRLATQLDGDAAQLAQAATILLTLPGTPFMYYGEEIGLANGPSGRDEDKRTPMPWDTSGGGGFTAGTPWHRFAPGRENANVAAQTDEPGSLLARYRALIRLRRGSEALRQGSVQIVPAGMGGGAILAYLRETSRQRVLVIHNLSAAPTPASWEIYPPAFEYRQLFGDHGVGLPVAGALTLPAHATGIWEIR